MVGVTQLKRSIVEKDLGALENTKVEMCQRCALSAMQVNGNLVCIRQSTASWLKKVMTPLYWAPERPHPESSVLFWSAVQKSQGHTGESNERPPR